MMDRVPGESFLDPFDVGELRDFNVFMLIVTFTTMIVHHASWIGAGITSAAKSPHEQKMAGLRLISMTEWLPKNRRYRF